MSAYEKRQKVAALAQLAAQMGAGIGSGGPMGNWGERMGQMSANFAQAAAEKERQEELEKAEKSKGLGKIGSLLGGLAGTAIGGPVGGALGGALGSAGGQAAGGGGVDFTSVLGSGVQGGLGGIMAKNAAAAGAPSTMMKEGVAQAPEMVAAPTANTAATPGFSPSNPLPGITAPPGTNTVLASNTPPAVPFNYSVPAPAPRPTLGQNLFGQIQAQDQISNPQQPGYLQFGYGRGGQLQPMGGGYNALRYLMPEDEQGQRY